MANKLTQSLFCGAVIILFVISCLSPVKAQGRSRKKLPPYEYGTVVIDQFSEANKMAPVIFRHWVHRSKNTCRLCHVDIGFSMKAGATGIREEDIRAGRYCGVCHNGKDVFGWEQKNVLGKTEKNCDRCHSRYPVGMDSAIKNKFFKLASTLPRGRFGNGIEWVEAEEKGLIKPKDFIEGVSFPRSKMRNYKGEIDITAKLAGLPDIIFSHKKHSVWNGCELCHPDIFTLKSGATKFTMVDNFNNKYCGVCHGKVAFPLRDCGLCHAKPLP